MAALLSGLIVLSFYFELWNREKEACGRLFQMQRGLFAEMRWYQILITLNSLISVILILEASHQNDSTDQVV